MAEERIVVTGAAGLVGQNLVPRLLASGFRAIAGIDKHPTNTAILAANHPDIRVIQADLAADDTWLECLADCSTLIVGHAQIGGLTSYDFVRNNLRATE